jgi:hypothetical protein
MSATSRIESLKKQIVNLGPVLPGSISLQWNVCGKAGCRCKDRKEPHKHGPYYQLSFTVGGKSSSMFLHREDLVPARQAVARYRVLRQLCAKLAAAYVAEARRLGLAELCQQEAPHG